MTPLLMRRRVADEHLRLRSRYRHKCVLPRSLRNRERGYVMRFNNPHTNAWMVVDVAYNGWTVVSTHGCQRDAESERDRRN
jgi:hypothetical protein